MKLGLIIASWNIVGQFYAKEALHALQGTTYLWCKIIDLFYCGADVAS